MSRYTAGIAILFNSIIVELVRRSECSGGWAVCGEASCDANARDDFRYDYTPCLDRTS